MVGGVGGSFGTISYCPLSLQTSYVPLNISGRGTWAYPDHSTAQLPPNVLDTQFQNYKLCIKLISCHEVKKKNGPLPFTFVLAWLCRDRNTHAPVVALPSSEQLLE